MNELQILEDVISRDCPRTVVDLVEPADPDGIWWMKIKTQRGNVIDIMWSGGNRFMFTVAENPDGDYDLSKGSILITSITELMNKLKSLA